MTLATERIGAPEPVSGLRRAAYASLLEEDPELVCGLPPGELPRVARAARARVIAIPPGPVLPHLSPMEDGGFGFLVLDGLLSTALHLDERLTIEILGTTDVTRPGGGGHLSETLDVETEFSALTETSVAVLDAAFARRVAAWPQVASGLMARLVLRARRLHLQTAVRSLPAVRDRILLMLWHYADRWGRVTPNGVILDLPVGHEQMAAIIGVRRPSVTTSLGVLRRQGVLEQVGRSGWRLFGEPPPALGPLYRQTGLIVSA